MIEFEQACREHWHAVTRCVAAKVRSGDGHVVDDLVQVAFVRAWKALNEKWLKFNADFK